VQIYLWDKSQHFVNVQKWLCVRKLLHPFRSHRWWKMWCPTFGTFNCLLEAMDDERCATFGTFNCLIDVMDDERCATFGTFNCLMPWMMKDVLSRANPLGEQPLLHVTYYIGIGHQSVKWGQSDPMLVGFCSKQTSALVSWDAQSYYYFPTYLLIYLLTYLPTYLPTY
jgi:hypothetical protein